MGKILPCSFQVIEMSNRKVIVNNTQKFSFIQLIAKPDYL